MGEFIDKNIWEPRPKLGVEYINIWGNVPERIGCAKDSKEKHARCAERKEAIWD